MTQLAESSGQGERPNCLSVAIALSAATHLGLIVVLSSGGSLDSFLRSESKEAHRAIALSVRLPAQSDGSGSSDGGKEPNVQQAASVDAPNAATNGSRSSTMAKGADESVGLSIPASHYYPLSELDEHPGIAVTPELDQLAINGPTGLNGQAKIELFVESDGSVNEVKILETNLPAPYPDNLRKIFKKVQYNPGRLDGRTVRMKIMIAVEYVDGISSIPPHRIEDGRVRLEKLPQLPITLMPDRHQRKQNPPRQP